MGLAIFLIFTLVQCIGRTSLTLGVLIVWLILNGTLHF